MKIVEARETSFACPSQWEGTLDDGREFYLRERHGQARLDVPYGTTVRAIEVVEGSCGDLASFLRVFSELELAPDAKIVEFDLDAVS
jgi:hypothetical protein